MMTNLNFMTSIIDNIIITKIWKILNHVTLMIVFLTAVITQLLASGKKTERTLKISLE